MGQLVSFTTAAGNVSKQNCFVFVEAGGFEVMSDALTKFSDSEEIVSNILKILTAVLKYLTDDSIYLRLASTSVPKTCIAVLENEKIPEAVKLLALELVDKLSDLRITHDKLIEAGALSFINKAFQNTLQSKANINPDNLKRLVRIFDLITNFITNPRVSEKVMSSGVVENMVQIYNQYQEVTFLRDIFVNSIYEITKLIEGQKIIKKSNLNLEDLIHHGISTQNEILLGKISKILTYLTDRSEVKQKVEDILAGKDPELKLIFVAFVTDEPAFSDLLDNDQLIQVALNIVKANKNVEHIFGATKFLSGLALLSSKSIGVLQGGGQLDPFFALLERKDSPLMSLEVINLLRNCIKTSGESFCKTLESYQFVQKVSSHYSGMTKALEEFVVLALTTEKALDSIEYHKSDVTKALLESSKEVKANEIVPMKKATEYIFAESISASLVELLNQFFMKNKKAPFAATETFINACHAQIKCFKNSKRVFTAIFDLLCKSTFPKELVDHICNNLKWPFILCDTVWKKNGWKFFALYVIRWLENLVAEKDNLRSLTKDTYCIKLVASIKHFINEDDYKDFEEETSNPEESDQLEYSHEREIQNKGTKIIEKLMDPALMNTFKSTIEKSITSFKPLPETIQILRAEYAVMSSINAINFFGCEGLRGKVHLSLRQNIDDLEKVSGRRDFQDKEKLFADCVKSLSNYVCITWNETGKNLYEQNEISSIVFELFDKYLRESKRPLTSYVFLKAYKEWLVNRIEIIEAVSNSERDKIYDPDSFMMVLPAKREATLTNALDSLYQTVTTFESNGKVVSISYEVIILLGYIYPKWKSKVAKNFIPLALNSLVNAELPHDTDEKAIDLLSNLLGLDEKSEAPIRENAKLAAQSGGLEKICKAIADNGFDEKFVAKCQPLVDLIAAESSLSDLEDLIAKLIGQIRDFNNLPDGQKDAARFEAASRAAEQLNSICVTPVLRDYAFSLGHTDVVGGLLDFCNRAKPTDAVFEASVQRSDKAATVALKMHLVSANDEDKKRTMFGDPKQSDKGLIPALLKALQREKGDPELVGGFGKIVNSLFPSVYALTAKNAAKALQFQPDLEAIYKNYAGAADGELAQEATNLFVNLSEKQDDDMIERLIRKILRNMKDHIDAAECGEVADDLRELMGYANHPVFAAKFDDLDVLDYIVRMEKLEQAQLKLKTGKKPSEVLDDALGSQGIPDLGSSQKKALEPENQLAVHLAGFILGLPEPLKEKVRAHKEIPKLTDAFLLLHGGPQVFEVLGELLQNPANQAPLAGNSAIPNAVYVLMKNNKDAFKPTQIEFTDSGNANKDKSALLSKSMLHHKVELERKEAEDKDAPISKPTENDAQIPKTLEAFNAAAQLLVSPKSFYNIIEEYIKAQNNFVPRSEESIAKLLGISREMSALLQAKIPQSDLAPYARQLAASMLTFLEKAGAETLANKKVFSFFETISLKLAKQFDETPLCFRSAPLWNKILERYFVLSPAIFKNHPKKVLKLLNLTAPARPSIQPVLDAFYEPRGKYTVSVPGDSALALSEKNDAGFDKIAQNFDRAIETMNLKPQLFYPTLEALTRAKNLSPRFVESPLFIKLLEFIVLFEKHDFPEQLETLSRALINCFAKAQESPEVREALNKKFHADNLLLSFISNIENDREDLIPISTQVLQLAFGVLQNKSAFFEKNFVETLANKLGEPESWGEAAGEKAPLLVLLGHLAQDPSLDKQFENSRLPEKCKAFAEKHVVVNPPSLKNPPQLFSKTSELSPENKTRLAEAVTYLLGEFSKDADKAKVLANCKGNKSNVFELYDAFERLEHQPVIATKMIEACRNGVYQLDDQTVAENEPLVDDLLPRLPPKIEKFKNGLDLVHVYLQDILDFFKKQKTQRAPTNLEKVAETLDAERKDDTDRLKDTKGLAEIYKEMSEKLQDGPLSAEDAKTLELANVTTKGMQKDPTTLFTLFNLEIPKYLRLIANSPHSTMFQKNEALDLLNDFARNEDLLAKMVSNPFMVDKSAELIDTLTKPLETFTKLKPEECAVINSDLEFMRQLTNDQKGVLYALAKDSKETPLIDDLFKILKSDTNDPFMKINALEVLMNLLKFSPPDLDKRVLKELPQLYEKNLDLYELLCALAKITGTLAAKSGENKQTLTNSEVIPLLKKGNELFSNGKKLQTNSAFALFNIANEFEPSHQKILDSGILPLLASPFRKTDSDKEMHENMCKTLLQIGFQNNPRKEELLKSGFSKGLVALLIHYSSPEFYDADLCGLVLKCMANFSLIPKGVDILMADGVIPAFRNFFAEYKEKLPSHMKLMMATISNLSYEPRPEVLDRILADKGVELILDTLGHFAHKNDPDTTEVCIDALTHVAASPKTLDYLTKTNVVDVLVDFLRQQMNDRLVYKDLRCFTRLVENEKLAQRFMDKGGHSATLDALKPFRDDPKVVFQGLKLIATVLDRYPDRLEDFIFAGVPEKVIQAFRMNWK